jgi:O-methyltransferase
VTARTTARSLAHRLGFEVHRASNPAVHGWSAADAAPDAEYYREWPSSGPMFAPWAGHPDFERLYAGVADHTLVSRDRCYLLSAFARYASGLAGDAAECGVYKGGTALLLSRVLAAPGRRLYLFDSFEGLPEVDPDKDAWFSTGQFAIDSVESVRGLLAEHEDLVEIRQGWIPDTFAGLEDRRYAFAHVDVDLYRSAADCCEYFYPRMVPGGVLLFDEYGCPDAHGERDAVDEFLADKPEAPIALPTGQAVVIRLPDPQEAR